MKLDLSGLTSQWHGCASESEFRTHAPAQYDDVGIFRVATVILGGPIACLTLQTRRITTVLAIPKDRQPSYLRRHSAVSRASFSSDRRQQVGTRSHFVLELVSADLLVLGAIPVLRVAPGCTSPRRLGRD